MQLSSEKPMGQNPEAITTAKEGQVITGLPTTGVYEFLSSSGKMVITYQEGKREGEALSYDAQGHLILRFFFKQNLRDGLLTRYYPGGLIEITVPYIDNLIEGISTSYYQNGGKHFEATYRKGKLNGEFIFYDNYGHISQRSFYEKGLLEGQSTTFFPSSQGGGVCQISHYHQGILVKYQDRYYPDGKILQKTSFLQGKPVDSPESFDNNGKVIMPPPFFPK